MRILCLTIHEGKFQIRKTPSVWSFNVENFFLNHYVPLQNPSLNMNTTMVIHLTTVYYSTFLHRTLQYVRSGIDKVKLFNTNWTNVKKPSLFGSQPVLGSASNINLGLSLPREEQTGNLDYSRISHLLGQLPTNMWRGISGFSALCRIHSTRKSGWHESRTRNKRHKSP